MVDLLFYFITKRFVKRPLSTDTGMSKRHPPIGKAWLQVNNNSRVEEAQTHINLESLAARKHPKCGAKTSNLSQQIN